MTDRHVSSESLNERALWGRDPDPLTLVEWVIVLACTAGALGIIGGLVWLCLVLIRG